MPRRLHHDDYTVAWICGLPLEVVAAAASLDERHLPPLPPHNDTDSYVYGRVHTHNVVIASPPVGTYGTTSAARFTASISRSFKQIQFGLLVGIGGGIPQSHADIRLGDVVVGMTFGNDGCVVGLDFGKDGSHHLIRTLPSPPPILRAAVAELRDNIQESEKSQFSRTVLDLFERLPDLGPTFERPKNDRLFDATYSHHDMNFPCRESCSTDRLINRENRDNDGPHIHYGVIASVNRVIKDAMVRDKIAESMNILCFEKGAVGLVEGYPCLIIRGIWDYCDSHQSIEWQPYACLTAAAYANRLLSLVPSSRVDRHLPEISPDMRINATAPATDSGYASVPQNKYKEAGQSHDQHKETVSNTHKVELNRQPVPANSDTNEDSVCQEGLPLDDACSVYTDGPDIQPFKKDAYISAFAEELFNAAITTEIGEEDMQRVYPELPGLLKTFAMKLGSSAESQAHRDVMVFIRKHRGEISKTFADTYLDQHTASVHALENQRGKMDLADLMDRWYRHQETPEHSESPDEGPGDDMDNEDPDDDGLEGDKVPEISVYKGLISQATAYEWLLQSVRRGLLLDVPEDDTETTIGQMVLDYLPKSQIVSRKEPPKNHSMIFSVDWDPGLFLEEQEYTGAPERALGRAITITGSRTNGQAMTTIQYITQTWPSNGIHLLDLVKAVVQSAPNIQCSMYLLDGTEMTAWFDGSRFYLQVIGIAECIAETGQQLAWLSAAFCSSPYHVGVTSCSPFISNIGTTEDHRHAASQSPSSMFFCDIGFDFELHDQSNELLNGQCWHNLFRNPVVVSGYPIRRRITPGMGLEVGLDIMATLVGAKHLTTFDNNIFIKGFSAMLFLTQHTGGAVFWHLLYNETGERVSYLESQGHHAERIGISDLERGRHIVGWCSESRYYAGACDAKYDIERSWLDPSHQACGLKDFSLSPGTLLQSGHQAAYGKKDKPPHVIKDPYRRRMQHISRKYVILWDVEYHRGWLVNGTSALLHLVHSSLEFSRENEAEFGFCYSPEAFKIATNRYNTRSATEVLMNTANLELVLYQEMEKDELTSARITYKIKDRVEDLYTILERMIDYQAKAAGRNGEGFKIIPRRYLEGWDFQDITTSEHHIYPRVTRLKTIGKGWVDFARTIQAVTLFGREFGDIIQPAESINICDQWSSVPADQYYLAADMTDLTTIMKRYGNPRANPPRLTQALVWHRPGADTDTVCPCLFGSETKEHVDVTQAILPLHIAQKLPMRNSTPPRDSGAVIFGHNKDFEWIWNDFDDPEQGQPPLFEKDDGIEDSGMGSSIMSSSRTSEATATVNTSPTASLTHDHYRIGIICALPKEHMAVRILLDEEHPPLPVAEHDQNAYALGRMESHNVVTVCLPLDDYGTNSAAKVASDMSRTFTSLKWYLVVGIGGGIPSAEHDIRLGDVVVGSGVLQYDMGKAIEEGSKFEITGRIQVPDPMLGSVVNEIRSNPNLPHDALARVIEDIVNKRPEYKRPGAKSDRVEDDAALPGQPRPGPRLHYGLVASGNQVVKNANLRDYICREKKALCFEMEAAGVMKTSQCLVIRGICDYADSHKDDRWQEYAAATAAAYAKLFLSRLRNPRNILRIPSPFEISEPLYRQKRPATFTGNFDHETKRHRHV